MRCRTAELLRSHRAGQRRHAGCRPRRQLGRGGQARRRLRAADRAAQARRRRASRCGSRARRSSSRASCSASSSTTPRSASWPSPGSRTSTTLLAGASQDAALNAARCDVRWTPSRLPLDALGAAPTAGSTSSASPPARDRRAAARSCVDGSVPVNLQRARRLRAQRHAVDARRRRAARSASAPTPATRSLQPLLDADEAVGGRPTSTASSCSSTCSDLVLVRGARAERAAAARCRARCSVSSAASAYRVRPLMRTRPSARLRHPRCPRCSWRCACSTSASAAARCCCRRRRAAAACPAC